VCSVVGVWFGMEGGGGVGGLVWFYVLGVFEGRCFLKRRGVWGFGLVRSKRGGVLGGGCCGVFGYLRGGWWGHLAGVTVGLQTH